MPRFAQVAVTLAILLGVGWLVLQTADREAATEPENARQRAVARQAAALPGREEARRDAERGGAGPEHLSQSVQQRLQHARDGAGPDVKQRRAGDAGREDADPDGKIFAPFDVVDRGEQPIEATHVTFEPGAGVVLTDDSELIFAAEGNVDGAAGTIHFAIEPDWEGGDDSNRTLVRIDAPGSFQSRIQVIKNGEFLRFMFVDADGADRNLTFSIAEWHPGERHQVSATWGDGRLALYVDGEEAAKLEFSGAIDVGPDSQLALGSTTIDGFAGARARITDFTVHNRPIPPSAP